MKKRWMNRERSQLIGFAWVLVAVGCIGGIERGNLPVGGGIIMALCALGAAGVFMLKGRESK